MRFNSEKYILFLLFISCVVFLIIEQSSFYNVFFLGLYELYLCGTLAYFLKKIFCKDLTANLFGLIIIACIVNIFFLQKNSFILLFESSIISGGFHSS